MACVIICENEHFFLRDDYASGIIIDNDRRYSVFCKNPYRRMIVYNSSESYAKSQFLENYNAKRPTDLD
jgi:hypothetical protein